MSEITRETIGYRPVYEAARIRLGFGDTPVARVISESRGMYRVKNETGEYTARVTGKHMFEAVSREEYPAVGDWVAITVHDAENATIEVILPRISLLKRTFGDRNRGGEKRETQVIAANVDVALVVQSVGRDYNLNRFERYFALAEAGGVRPVIVLNKIDMLSADELEYTLNELRDRFPELDVIGTSVVRSDGIEKLVDYIQPGMTYCFLGSSGVGKSSLINALLGGGSIKTGAVGTYSERGKHVTTSRQMYFLETGGIVIDNPGIREVGLADGEAGVETLFDDIAAMAGQCEYSDCTHTHEPGCAVKDAVAAGALDAKRYSNYVSLKKEAEFQDLSEKDRRVKDRTFGKFLKQAKKDLKDLK